MAVDAVFMVEDLAPMRDAKPGNVLIGLGGHVTKCAIVLCCCVSCAPSTLQRGTEQIGSEVLSLRLSSECEMRMCHIPAGTFSMTRSIAGGAAISSRTITIKQPFYMGMFEVTEHQWVTVMGKQAPHCSGDQMPIQSVSWNECQEFCERMSRLVGRRIQLPLEEEWEHACRAGSTTPFAFGETLAPTQANYYAPGGANGSVRPVGSYRPNKWGLYDMHGNVIEWCCNLLAVHPDVELTSWHRVARGGSWLLDSECCRSGAVMAYAPDSREQDLGFRVVTGGDETGRTAAMKESPSAPDPVYSHSIQIAHARLSKESPTWTGETCSVQLVQFDPVQKRATVMVSPGQEVLSAGEGQFFGRTKALLLDRVNQLDVEITIQWCAPNGLRPR